MFPLLSESLFLFLQKYESSRLIYFISTIGIIRQTRADPEPILDLFRVRQLHPNRCPFQKLLNVSLYFLYDFLHFYPFFLLFCPLLTLCCSFLEKPHPCPHVLEQALYHKLVIKTRWLIMVRYISVTSVANLSKFLSI